MKTLKIIILLTVAALMFGCATGKYYPDHAFKRPIDAISIIHPVEIEKKGVKFITIFYFVIDPALMTEMVGTVGVWPIIGRLDNGKIIGSYAYFWTVTPWGDLMLRAEVQMSKEEAGKYKFLSSSRDGQYLFTLKGKQIPLFSKDKNVTTYDPRKFSNNDEYRKDLFEKYGMKMKELGAYWNGYIRERDPGAPNIDDKMIIEIKVGSPLWRNYKEDLKLITASNPRMGNGEIRLSLVSLERFKGIYIERPGFNSKERLLKKGLNVPILPLMGPETAIIAAANIVGNAVSANIDDRLEGFYASAEVLRYDLAPMFRYIVYIYKDLLEKRDLEIKKLAERNRILRKIANDH